MPTDFFISYTGVDTSWAEWMAWVLEEKLKYTTVLQAWDFVPGSNFVLEMQRAAASASRTIAVLSPDYLRSAYARPEWAAAFAQDPEGMKRTLVPVMVRDCATDGLLNAIVHIKLVNLSEEEAERALFKGLTTTRRKPDTSPGFPGAPASAGKAAVPFPGATGGTESHPFGRPRPAMPRIRGAISDLDRTHFIKQSFDVVREYFREGIEELGKQPAVDAEFTEISATSFTAEAFVNGRKAAQCKIWLGKTFSADQIRYYEGTDNFGETYNEALGIARDDYELRLSALMEIGFTRTEALKNMDLKKLSSEEAAEYLWQRFISRLR
ncbi:MAG TPA: toll/interleukin-1 receptor domain-containing protein [Ktedonobacteraceae bacterium]|nr:toll/interleukin-1 receptor domain-containing protein [Ktedonobacteraceae bacterium]